MSIARVCAIVLLGVAGVASAQSPTQIIAPGRPNEAASAVVRSDGLIYVGGTVGAAADGAVSGDIKAQAARTLDNIAAMLKGHSTLGNVAKVTVSLRNVADFPGLNEVFTKYFPKDPPARTTIVTDGLSAPGALVEISVVAIPTGGERIVILPKGWVRPTSPYSYGIKSGSTLFLAGLINRNGADNSSVPGDITAQTKTVMGNASAILEAAGMSLADVVSSRVFLTDPAGFQAMNTAYREFFPAAPPARATVKAGMVAADALIEITMVAVKDASRKAIIPPNADGTPGRPGGNLSPAIQVGRRLYVAGMTGNTPATKGDVKGQTVEVLTRLGRALRAAGYQWSDVVDETAFLPDMARLAEMDAARREVYGKSFPARVTLGTPLMGADAIVEIMVTAVK